MGRRLCFLVGNIYKKWLGVIIPPLIILTAEHDNFIRNNGALEIETKYWLTFKLRNLSFSKVFHGEGKETIFSRLPENRLIMNYEMCLFTYVVFSCMEVVKKKVYWVGAQVFFCWLKRLRLRILGSPLWERRRADLR